MSGSNYSEEEAIEKAVALSLLTAQEDDKRRKENYGTSDPGHRSTGSSPVPSGTGTSLISRPRPQSRGASPIIPSNIGNTQTTTRNTGSISNTPVIPPRPDNKVVEDARASHSYLHGAPLKPPPPHSRSGSRQKSTEMVIPQRPPPPSFSSKSSPSSNITVPSETPLITLSPDPKSAKSSKDSETFDFDLESLDPLKDSSNTIDNKSSNKNSLDGTVNVPQSNVSLVFDKGRTDNASPVFSNLYSGSNNSSTATTPVSSWDKSFSIFGQPQEKTGSKTTEKWASFDSTKPKSVGTFDSKPQMLGLQGQGKVDTDVPSNPFLQPVTSSTTTIHFPNYNISGPTHPQSTTTYSHPLLRGTASANPYGYGYDNKANAHFNTYGYGYDTSSVKTACGNHNAIRRVPSDQSIFKSYGTSNDVPYPINPGAALNVPSSLNRVPSDSSLLTMSQKSPLTVDISTTDIDNIAGKGLRTEKTPSENDIGAIGELTEHDNLMSFPERAGVSANTEEDLSFASFDPLYSIEESIDSLGIFTNPYDKFQRKDTPNPFPAINPVSTKKIMDKVMGKDGSKERGDQKGVQVSTVGKVSQSVTQQKTGHMRKQSTGELLDPFSVSDLTHSLEKKRQSHVKELQKEALLRKKKEVKDETHERGPVVTKASAKSSIKPDPKILCRRISNTGNIRQSTYEILQQHNEAAQDEVKAFCDIVARLKRQYPSDHPSNNGIIINPRVEYPAYVSITVKVTVFGRFMIEPYIFTPSLDVVVQHIICEILLSLTDDLQSTSADDYLIKVFGRNDYLLSDTKLGDYEYVQTCLRTDEDIKLVIVDYGHVERPLLRTEQDDKQPVLVPKHKDTDDPTLKVTRDKLNILMETYYREIEKLRDAAIQDGCKRVQCRSVVQAVKAICAVLYKIETIDIIKAVQRLCVFTANVEPGLRTSSMSDKDSFLYVTNDGEGHMAVVDTDGNSKIRESFTQLDDLHMALEELTSAVKGQIDLFCRTFHTDFRFGSATDNVKEKREIRNLDETLLLQIATLHCVPLKFKDMFESYKVRCGLYYGGKKLCNEIITKTKPNVAEGLHDTFIWDEWMNFDTIYLNRIPRESRLCVEVIGVKVTQSTENVLRVNQPLGWAVLQLFNHKFELVQGSQLLGLWKNENANPTGTTVSAAEVGNCVLLQLNLPDFDYDYTFPAVLDPLPGLQKDYDQLHGNDQEQLHQLCLKSTSCRMTKDVREYIWEKRHYLYKEAEALPKVLQSTPTWDWRNLQEIYTMIEDWAPLSATQAIELLLPLYPDTFVRTKAVEWISILTDDQLVDILPQLIQALKFECYHTSALAKLLVERSILNARFSHQLYWLLKEAADDIHFRKRYQLVFGALLSVVGDKGRKEFGKEEDLVKILASIAEKVKAAKDKEKVLQNELNNMWEFFEHSTVRLPINPGMIVYGLDCKSCSYFSSNAFPLRLVFKNIETRAGSIYTMFKSGDDLRQDVITMQVIRIMDRLWRKENLDLKMITFKCQPTGFRKGLVELVTECDTLRKIQVKHGKGVAGSFKDTTIREWLQLHNPTELEFEKAIDNFIASCAGYCVATYVLGICDRHNDNIMVKQSGHLFHIDFGKFLGDAQMFGNFKRDRTPFVLTSDMAYVINGGDKPTHKFQHFIDLCCTAFNIIRKHSSFFINLFSLMVHSGIPGVNEQATKYIGRALLPDHSDSEATAVFTRMIEECLKSTFTQWNFFIHNLAQMKFSGHNEGALLSFIPKTYSIHTDGKITNVEVFGYQKRYNPEKYYLYIIKVDRVNQKVPSFIFRRYSEFQELSHKLMCQFPLVKLPNLSNKVLLGRTHVKSVAEERKVELEFFIRDLLILSVEIAEHDLVYTFFHPMLRDEQDIDKTNLQKLKEPSTKRQQTRKIDGQIKLSLCYKNDELTVMVMHVKDLASCGGEPPDPYVKLYLLPDPFKETKKKTKIVKGTFHPTYNEMLIYRMPLGDVKQRSLSASVWSYDALSENEYLGSARIKLCDVNWTGETISWYKLLTNPGSIS